MYKVTRVFLNGNLAGMEYTEITPVKFQVGKIYKPCVGKGDYKVIACLEI